MLAEKIEGLSKAQAEAIQAGLSAMGKNAALAIVGCVDALLQMDPGSARRILVLEREIRTLARRMDQACLNHLASPALEFGSLHFLTLALKIVIDLKQIGVRCATIAMSLEGLPGELRPARFPVLGKIAEQAGSSVSDAVRAFVAGDAGLASRVFQGAGRLDDMHEQLQIELFASMVEAPASITCTMRLNPIMKGLQSISEHAIDLSETVLFMDIGRRLGASIRELAVPRGVSLASARALR